MRALHEKWTTRQLERLAEAIVSHPSWFIYPQLLLAIGCFVFALTNLQFSVTRADLISEKVPHQKQYRDYKREFQMPDAFVAVVESESPDKNRRFIERVAAKVLQEPHLFKSTYFKGDLKTMGPKSLLFLPEETLEELHRVIDEAWPVISELAGADSLDTMFRLVNRQFREGADEEFNGEKEARALLMMRVIKRLLDEGTRSVTQPLTHKYPGLVALFGDHSQLYVTFGGGEIYALVTHAARPEVEGEAVERLRELVKETGNEVPGVNFGISGEPVLNHDEMKQAHYDIQIASLVSAALVALIFMVGFHEVARPLLATLCLAVGIFYSLAFATLAVGRLNLLSITLVPILIGLSIDFAVHLISRYEEELRAGNNRQGAIRKALALSGIGVFTGAFTTAAAFFAMLLTDFKGIQEMGLVSGAGLLLCLIPMMTMLPALLIKYTGKGTPVPSPGSKAQSFRRRVEEGWLRHPRLILGVAGGLTLASLILLPRITFDYNLLNLQTEGLPAVGIEEKLIQSGAESLLQGVVIADSLEEAAELQAKLEALPPVSHVSSMVDYLAEDQSRELQLVRDIKAKAADLELAPRSTGEMDVAELDSTLFGLQGYLGLALERFQAKGTAPELSQELEALRDSVIQFRSLLGNANRQTIGYLTDFQNSVFANLTETIELIRNQDASGPLRVEDLPSFFRERYISPSGKFLLEVHPKEDLWLREEQKEFVTALRSVAPNVTGTVVQIYEFTSLLRESFLRSTAYAALIILVVLLIHFRQPIPALLGFFPVILALVWLLGVMALFNIPFNPVNIMAPTLLIGIGIANGVHILNRFAEEPCPAILSLSTGKAILISALTTVAGFGALLVARHQGIASLGLLMAVGTVTCLFAPLGALPSVLTLWNSARRHDKRSSERPLWK